MIGRPGAQTWGWLVVYTDARYRTEDWAAGLRVHEHVHVFQGFILGPVFAALYGLAFVMAYLANGRNWYTAYRAIPFEVWAYHVGDNYKPGTGSWGD